MSNPPPTPPPPPPVVRPPAALEYGKGPSPHNNVWWKVLLRIIAGLAAGIVTVLMGFALSGSTNIPSLMFVPPGIVFAALLFVAIKFRRFGYVTGFILAPFIIAAVVVIVLLIICGSFMATPHP